MPLSIMQGRGELKLARLKIADARFALDFKSREMLNKLRAHYNDLIITQQQTILYEESIENFRRLFEGETISFNNGESSLFLVNARENRYIDSQVKLAELQAKYYKTEAALRWTAGNISR